MITDKKKLSDDKTEFMFLGTYQQLSKVRIDKLFVGDVIATPVSVSCNWGVWFDSHVSYVTHIKKNVKLRFSTFTTSKESERFLLYSLRSPEGKTFSVYTFAHTQNTLVGRW